YLDVWQRHVTAVEDPAIREVALGGPDTCTREKTVWQLKLHRTGDVGSPASCADLPAEPSPRGRLAARAKQPPTGTNPCIIEPGKSYRRLENQLYRVEIHGGGRLGVDAGITFKFSRDNGAVVTRWLGSTASTLTVASAGRDAALGFAAGQWIELIDDERELSGAAGTLVQIEAVEGTTLRLRPGTATGSTDIADFRGNPRVRRWDHATPTAALAVERPASNEGYLLLEDGVEVRFEDGVYEPGDYWLIPARTITADVEWARDLDGLPIAAPRHGVAHRRVALGVVEWSGAELRVLSDCRDQFPPLTDICAADVRLEDDPCGRGWKTVQDAVEALCQETDLEFHNQHLHGFGVVCGLQVQCLTEEIARRRELPRPREVVLLRNGYAIHPTGVDILVRDEANETLVPLGDLIVSEGIAQRNESGDVPDLSVSLWIDRDGSLHVEPYAADKQPLLDELLDGTLLRDIYDHCIVRVVDFLKEQVTPQPDEGLVGPTAKRLITFLNLLWQLVNPQSGSHVYLSGEPDPETEGPNKEDHILRSFFRGLKGLLQSETFCAMFDDTGFPAYDVYRDDLPAGTPRPSTIFGKGFHRRLRVHPDERHGFTCGNGGAIHIYDLAGEKMLSAVDFPVAGAEVQDVAFNASGTQLYAIAWIGDAKADTVFAVGDIAPDFTVSWTLNQVHCDLKLVTLATLPRVPNIVYAAARGSGVYPFEPSALVPNPAPIATFLATGHLVAAEGGRRGVLYAGAHTEDMNPVAYNLVVGIDLANTDQLRTFSMPHENDEPVEGQDDIAIATSRELQELYAIADAPYGKQLVAWDPREPGAPVRTVPLGPSSASHLAFSPLSGHVFVTYEDTCLGREYFPGERELKRGEHPLQIGPVSVAVGDGGRRFYVLNWMSNTITAVPAYYGSSPLSPWESTIDIAKLKAYRTAVILAFLKVIGKFLQYLKDCVCEQLLIRCPDPAGKKVYLADISFKEGKVYQICNFHRRRYVHTFPTVEYWMSAVPVLPLLKKAVETVCCSVITGFFDSLEPPSDTERDAVSTTKARYTVAHVKDANVLSLLRGQLSQITGAGALGRALLDLQVSRPPAGQTGKAMSSTDIVNRPVEEVSRLAASRNATVTSVSTAKRGGHDALSVFRTAVAPARVRPGDAIELITDSDGQVIAYSRASGQRSEPGPSNVRTAPPGTVAATPATPEPVGRGTAPVVSSTGVAPAVDLDEALSARDAEIAQLRSDLSELRRLHERSLGEAADVRRQLEALSATVARMNR
ncbi:hypothetical protein BE08_35050, partial [Sorangium cellulosum]